LPVLGVLFTAFMIIVSQLKIGVSGMLHRVFWYELFWGAYRTLKMRAVYSAETLVRVRNTA